MKSLCLTLTAFLALTAASFAQGNANPSDMSQARSFVANLPPACGSDIDVRADGTVVVSYACKGNGQVAIGNVHIKDGKITKLN